MTARLEGIRILVVDLQSDEQLDILLGIIMVPYRMAPIQTEQFAEV
jgi:hypothetical protein